MSDPGKQSIWKKEITLRRKPKEKGLRVPPVPEQAPKPESVAELLRPIAEEAVEPIVFPPVTPQVSPAFPPIAPPLSPPASSAAPTVPPVASDVPPVSPDVPPVRPDVPPVEADAPSGAPDVPPVEADAPSAAPDVPPVSPASPISLPPKREELEPEPEPGWGPEPEAPPAEAPESFSLPVPEPEPPAAPEKPTRRERKSAKREAERLEKEERRNAKKTAKEQKKAGPSVHKRLVGLKIGASQVAAAQIANGSGARVVRMARMPLERGIVIGGELREQEELTAALKAFFRKNKLPKNAVRLGIANNRIGVRTFEISGIDDAKQLANAIRFRAQETLPIPLDEAVLDYRILEDRVGADGVHTRRVLLVVAHRELVERYVAACKKAGLKLVGIDLEAFALLRALGDPAQQPAAAEDAGLVCISIGHDRSTLAVSDGRVCEFTRVLPWGGSSLDAAVARVLDLIPSEAEPVKHELSLGEEGEAAGLDAQRADEVRRAMAAELQVFARELVASLRFYQEQPGSLGIGEILITGGASQCGGLAEELEQLIGVAVRVADPLTRVKVPRKLRKVAASGAGSLAIAVGLGIDD